MDELEAIREIVESQGKKIAVLEAKIKLAIEFLQNALDAVAALNALKDENEKNPT